MGLSNITWSSELGLGQIIILIAYAVGFLITYFHQKKKIGILITQIDKQKSILEQVERYMNIFDLDKVEKFVQMSEKTVQMEKEEMKKQYEYDSEKSTKFFLDEIINLVGVLFKLSSVFAYEPYFEKTINEVKNVFFKQRLLGAIKKSRENLKSLGIEDKGISGGILRALLMRGEYYEEISQLSSQKKQ